MSGDRNGFVPLAVAAGATVWAATELLSLRRVVVLLERCGQAPVPPPRLAVHDLPPLSPPGSSSADRPPAA